MRLSSQDPDGVQPEVNLEGPCPVLPVDKDSAV